jgi:hypothetical protein
MPIVQKRVRIPTLAAFPSKFLHLKICAFMTARINCLVALVLGLAFCLFAKAQDRDNFSPIGANQPAVLATRSSADGLQFQRDWKEAGANRNASINSIDELPGRPRLTHVGYQDPDESSTGRFPRNDYLQEPERRSGIGVSSREDESIFGSAQERLSVGEIRDGRLYLNNCTVLFIDDVKLPARESGQIIQLNVKEGDSIQAKQILAQLDDNLFRFQLKRAEISYENAKDKAEDTTTIDAHHKEVELQKAKLDRTTNLYQKGSQNLAEYQIAKFEHQLAELKVKAAENSRKQAEGEARIELAQIDEIKQRIARHQLSVDFDGYVIELLKQKQEWANAGDPVMRVARMDRLAVQAIVGTNVVNPHQIRNQQNVVVTLQMAGGKSEQFRGKISNVALVRETGTLIKIRAEVENQKVGDQNWLLQPLSVVEMVVELN